MFPERCSPQAGVRAARGVAVFLLITCSASTLRAQVAPWWAAGPLQAGPFPVGFTTSLLSDTTRNIRPHTPRRVQESVWYPSARPGTPAMTFAGYLGISATETTDVRMSTLDRKYANSYRAFLASQSVPDSMIDLWFSSPMLAVYDAPRDDGPFPLVLLAEGNGESAVDQSVLGEYLASHGYVVATSPSQSRITGQPESESSVGNAAEDQADDLALICLHVRKRPDVLRQSVALIGHSFGARSALLYAMRDSSVVSLVSLDGGIGTATARASFENAPSFRPHSLRIPLLHFYEELDPPMTPEWGTLRKVKAGDIWIAKTGLHHHHFTTLGAASGRYRELAKETGAADDVANQYAAVLELTRSFLDATLRRDAESLTRFKQGSPILQPGRLPE